MSDNISERVRQFISGRYPQVTINDHDDIFGLGFVNSLFAIELVLFVEKTFRISLPNEELRIDNFRSVDSISGLVRQLAGASELR
ncbi:phosphopantetheine-binding protein [Amycolatopsis sp. lyj-112]|uniref:phosphopantetheine-binding protein n=1 Tax=Amycolatopsis sp. lyj-112 TaxID=2789288 RepID=UPI00397B069A